MTMGEVNVDPMMDFPEPLEQSPGWSLSYDPHGLGVSLASSALFLRTATDMSISERASIQTQKSGDVAPASVARSVLCAAEILEAMGVYNVWGGFLSR
jgi:hypothetical protein